MIKGPDSYDNSTSKKQVFHNGRNVEVKLLPEHPVRFSKQMYYLFIETF